MLYMPEHMYEGDLQKQQDTIGNHIKVITIGNGLTWVYLSVCPVTVQSSIQPWSVFQEKRNFLTLL